MYSFIINWLQGANISTFMTQTSTQSVTECTYIGGNIQAEAAKIRAFAASDRGVIETLKSRVSLEKRF